MKKSKRMKRERQYDVAFSTFPPNSLDKETNKGLPTEAKAEGGASPNVDYGWPTTRTYPRTLAEAFPKDNAEWFFPPEQRMRDKILFGIGAFGWIALLVYLWKTK